MGIMKVIQQRAQVRRTSSSNRAEAVNGGSGEGHDDQTKTVAMTGLLANVGCVSDLVRP